VVYTTTGGLETSSANLLYSGTDLTVYGLTVGRGAGAVSTNTAVGASALAANTTGSVSVAVGSGALQSNTSGGGVTAVGYQAGYSNTTGGVNTSFGVQALYSVTSGQENSAFGGGALYTNTGNYNSGFGREVLYLNTSGAKNTAQGFQALYSNTTASNNTAVGYQAGYSNTTGSVTALGYQALYSNTTTASNTAVGYQAGFSTTVEQNTYVGYGAGYTNTTGKNHVMIGYQAGYFNTTGSNNVFIGNSAGRTVTTGSSNTFIGSGVLNVSDGAGTSVTTGSKNVILGNYTGSAAPISATGSNYIVLSDGDGNVRGTFDTLGFRIGTTAAIVASSERLTVAVSSATNAGVFANGGGATDATVYIVNQSTSGNNLFTTFATEAGAGTVRGSISYNRAGGLVVYNTTSDYRAKDISGSVTNSGTLIDSIPVYMGKMKWATEERPMFIAHETPAYAHTGEKDAVDEDGNPVYQQMDASALIPVMWAEIQSLRKRLAALEST
jgi:hypothetical protein